MAVAAGFTGTVETPDNLLDGGLSFPGRAASIVSGNITQPTISDILAYKHWEVIDNGAAASAHFSPLNYTREWNYPTLLKGPCSILLYFAGTVAVTGIGSFTFGVVPSNWFPDEA